MSSARRRRRPSAPARGLGRRWRSAMARYLCWAASSCARCGEGPRDHPRLLGREDPDDRRRGGHLRLPQEVRELQGRRRGGRTVRRRADPAVRDPPEPGLRVLVPGLRDRHRRHRNLRLPASRCPHPVLGTTILWSVILAAVFWTWYRSEGTLSIHSITTQRREACYWATVFATFALGTASGDFTAASLGMGYLPSGISSSAVFLVPAVAWWRYGMNSILAFWFAYIVTRPLGASFSDWISEPSISPASTSATAEPR